MPTATNRRCIICHSVLTRKKGESQRKCKSCREMMTLLTTILSSPNKALEDEREAARREEIHRARAKGIREQ